MLISYHRTVDFYQFARLVSAIAQPRCAPTFYASSSPAARLTDGRDDFRSQFH